MNETSLFDTGMIGILLTGLFLALILMFQLVKRFQQKSVFRELVPIHRLKRAIGLAVEAGQRIHVSIGSGGLVGLEGASGLVGLSLLRRIARAASISDQPPIATSGDGVLSVLSQDTLARAHQEAEDDRPMDTTRGQLSGVTPFSYAVGTLPVILDQNVSTTILAGHFGSEAGLILDAAEEKGSVTLGGSDSLTGQAVIYAVSQNPLVGEELYASGAYVQAGPAHIASLRAQDVLRWLLVAVILGGAILKFLGIL